MASTPDLSRVVLPDGANLDVLFQRVRERFDLANDTHRTYKSRWEHFYGLYRSFKQMKDDIRDAPDRDVVLREAKKRWGTELFIPYSFATVETIAPRAISNRPRMLILPGGPAAVNNVENMKMLIDRQQEQIGYEIKLAEVAKQGHIYGLGWQKTGWRRDTRQSKRLELSVDSSEWVEVPYLKTLFDDPDAAWIDLFDMFWDPFGFDVGSCRYLFQRSWRDTEYCVTRLATPVEEGGWSNPAGLDPANVPDMGSPGEYDDNVQTRMRMAGHPDYQARDDQLHEVWEYWERDGEGRVITILDRSVPVNVAAHPYWHGELPFQIFRPATQANGQLPGIGEVEPIEDLQLEISQLRSQRRDNAALKMMQAFAFQEGFVDPNDLQLYPGAGIAVNGDPREMLMPINIGDIPNSGYQEEAQLQADIERTTGISDPVAGTGDASQTATGVQLVQAAANVRIAQKTRRIELELCQPAAVQWVSLNQQMILEKHVGVPAEPTPMEPGRRWETIRLTPAELAGEFIVMPEGGSIAPENVPQKRQDAIQLFQSLIGNPLVDQQKVLVEFLRGFDQKNPETWLAPQQRVPPIVMDILTDDFGIPPEMLEQALMMGYAMERAQREGVSDPGAEPHPPDELEPAPSGG